MKETKKLIILEPIFPDCKIDQVLNNLLYKGLITYNSGHTITDEMIESAFTCNKSLLCAKGDYIGNKQPIKIFIYDNKISDFQISDISFINFNDGNYNTQFENIMNCLNIDIGDQKSNVSIGNDKTSLSSCLFCNYIRSPNDYYNLFKTVYRTEHFLVTPGIGQFIKGYLLIIPYQHVMSIAELSREDLDEFNKVLKDVKHILSLVYHTNKFLVWENGCGQEGKNKAKDSIVHSHVHIAPSSISANHIKEMSGFDFQEISLFDLNSYAANSYLLIENEENGKWNICQNKDLYIPRQYIRQILAFDYGLSGEVWNWRTNPFIDNFLATTDEITNAIKEFSLLLSERIVCNTSFLFEENNKEK